MKADRHHHNPMGTVHGGIICDLADAAMGYAFAMTLGAGEYFTTAIAIAKAGGWTGSRQ